MHHMQLLLTICHSYVEEEDDTMDDTMHKSLIVHHHP